MKWLAVTLYINSEQRLCSEIKGNVYENGIYVQIMISKYKHEGDEMRHTGKRIIKYLISLKHYECYRIRKNLYY